MPSNAISFALQFKIDDKDVMSMFDRVRMVGKSGDLMQTLADTLTQDTRETFRNSADPFGTSWPPLATATLRWRQKKFGNYSSAPGVASGEMYDGMHNEVNGQTASVILGDGLADGRAVFFQDGGDRQPPRHVFPWEDDTLPDDWLDHVNQNIVDAYQAAVDGE